MKTDKCVKGEAEWKNPMSKKNQFNSRGTDIVDCLCGHKACSGKIKESTAYRHMRYGIDYKFPYQKIVLPKFKIEYRDPNSDSSKFVHMIIKWSDA